MLDFRYHALSLVAVFLALAIGIVLGVTIGDSLLSQAERGLRDDLRSDVVRAREDADSSAQQLRARDRFIERLRPGLITGRLNGRRVAIVSWGPLSGGVEDGVREAIREAGGRVDSESQFVQPLRDVEAATGDALAGVADEDSLESLGRRVARSLVAGGQLPGELRDQDGDRFSGRYAGADSVVFSQAPLPEEEDDGSREREGDQGRAFRSGLLDGLKRSATSVAAVEASDTDPSQIEFYRRSDLSSVDSVDSPGGQVALILVLAGAEGRFGFKSTAEEPLPRQEDLPAGSELIPAG